MKCFRPGPAGRILLAMGLVLALPGSGLGLDEEASEREVEALRARIAASRDRVEGSEREERNLLGAIQ